MKLQKLFTLLTGFFFITASFGQDWSWIKGSNTINAVGVYGTQGVGAIGNTPGARNGAFTWTDNSGNLWLFGGKDNSNNYFGDLWKYSASTNQWTWVKGPNTTNAAAVYGTQGVAAAANLPGARDNGVTWTDNNGNLWLFGGDGYNATTVGRLGDLWKYNIASNQWTWMKGLSTQNFAGIYGTQGVASASNYPGARNTSAAWFYNNKLYLYGGDGYGANTGLLGDLWSYDITTNNWTWIKGSNLAAQVAIYGTIGVESSTNLPGSRSGAAYWNANNGNLYFFGGSVGSNLFCSDVWRYNTATNNWTWIKGPNTWNNVGVYGTQGVAAVANTPGGRFKPVGNAFNGTSIFLFGGYGYTASGGPLYVNDLWSLNISTLQWTYIKGTTAYSQPGVYGTQGVSAPANKPGAREYHSSWNDASGNLWVFGGWGYGNSATFGRLNDLWKIPIGCNSITPTFTQVGSICSGGSFTLPTTSTNGITGTWSPAINTTASTTYTFTPNAGQCATSATMTVTVNQSTTPTFTQVAPICSGGSFTLPTTSNNAVTGTWTPAINNTATTTYTFTPVAGLCAATTTMTVTVNQSTTPTFTQIAPICGGGSFTLPTTSLNGITGTWSPAVNNTATTTYIFTPTPGQCASTATMTVTVLQSLAAPVITSSGPTTFCNGGSVLLSTTAVTGTAYQWKKNGVNIAGATTSSYLAVTSGVYTLTATIASGCSATSASTTVIVLPIPSVNAGADVSVCSGASVTLNATGAVSYSWNQGITNGVPFTPPTGTSFYTVVGTASNGCTDSDQLMITVNPGPQMNAGPDITICPGDQVTLYVPVDTSNVIVTSSTSGTYIADSSAQPYANSIQVSGFPTGSQITSAADLQSICLNIEHSFLGDIDMWLQCPSGQYVPLVNSYNLGTGGFLPGGAGGGSVFLGDPIDDITGPPGDGWQYCFSSVNATSGTFMNNIFNTLPVSIAGGNNADGFSMDPNPIYLPESSFSNLAGCPVNGTWTLFVQDVWQIDDGYIFDWSLDFGGSLNTGTVGAVSWTNGVTNNVPFNPSSTNTYTVTATNSFGCVSTDQVVVTVLPSTACSGGAGNNTFTNSTVPLLPFSQANFIPTVIDHNIDGKDDVYGYISNQPNSNRLWINNGNSTFTDISSSVNFPVRNNALITDFDKDGYSDVYYKSGDSILIHFRQNGLYQNAIAPCGIYQISSLFGISPTAHRQVQFNDFNNDGVHDLIVQIQSGNQSILKAIPGQLGCQTGCNYILSGSPQTLITLNTINNVYTKLADLDNDGDMDIMIGASPNQYQNSTYGLYSNDGAGVFNQISGSNYVLGRENAFGTVGELNNDGVPDILSGAADCCVGGDPLYVHFSNANLNYSASTTAISRYLDPYYQRASLVDLNLDTRKDVVWVSMAAIGSSKLQYHVNNGNNTFTESATLYNIHEGPQNGECCPIKNSTHGTVIDINSDNKPDLDIRQLDNVSPYMVTTDWVKINGTSNNALKLKLDACEGLREGWGARLKYKTGGQWYHQQHTANTQDGYPFLYLGMGANTMIDSIVIFWIGGNTSVLTNVLGNQFISVGETAFCSFAAAAAAVIQPNNDQTICENENYTLTANVTGATAYQWFCNGQALPGAVSNTIVPSITGSYYVIADDPSPCNISSDTVNIQVLPAPNLQLEILGGQDTLCDTECAYILAEGADQYLWYDGTQLDYNEVDQTGTYWVIGTGTNGCEVTDSISLWISPSTDTILYVTAIDQYTLNNDTYYQSGVYTQMLINSLGCDSTILLDLDLSFTGLSTIDGIGYSIYPNPAIDYIIVENSISMNASFILLDARGRKVMEGVLKGLSQKIDLSSIEIGTYFLKISDQEILVKIVKD